ncbi:MAG: phosphoglycerate dehydrogenase [Candidatus Omnitrophota bacterium]
MKIFVSTSSFGKIDRSAVNMLKKKGCVVSFNPHGRTMSEAEIGAAIKDADGLIAGTEPLTRRVMEGARSLKVISRCGTGMSNIDMSAAGSANIKVFNTPDAATSAVAELTVGLMLGILRKTVAMDASIRKGKWDKSMGSLLCGKRVGIIGFGRIGRSVAALLKPFGCEIAFADPRVNSAPSGIRRMGAGALLRWADIVTIHVSSKDELIGAKELRMMKKGSWLVNVSRGGVVNEDALYGALKDAHLAGAALDVFEEEPYNGRLTELDNIILTPHIGSYARESRILMEREAVQNLLKGLKAR